MSTDDKRIREFAYQIWESEGNLKATKNVIGKWRASWPRPKRWHPRSHPRRLAAKCLARLRRQQRKAPTARHRQPPKPNQRRKPKPAATAKVVPPGEKAAEKKPRAAKKPPAN